MAQPDAPDEGEAKKRGAIATMPTIARPGNFLLVRIRQTRIPSHSIMYPKGFPASTGHPKYPLFTPRSRWCRFQSHVP